MCPLNAILRHAYSPEDFRQFSYSPRIAIYMHTTSVSRSCFRVRCPAQPSKVDIAGGRWNWLLATPFSENQNIKK